MSDALEKSLARSKSNIIEGLADAEADLARARKLCREMEDLIATAKAVALIAGHDEGGASDTGLWAVVGDGPVLTGDSAGSPVVNVTAELMELLGYS